MTETHPPAALPTDSDSLLKQLCADFPQCFSEEASQVRPIAVGTKALLLDRKAFQNSRAHRKFIYTHK